MNDGTQDQVTVSFPATPTFSRIGRVTVAGLAIRLGVDIADVERLRVAVDHAVTALHGPGRIHLEARWAPHRLTVRVDNPDHRLGPNEVSRVAEALASMVDDVNVGPSSIDLALGDSIPGHSELV
ncbi:MAG: hypothetical protein ACK5RL_02555 [Acidimicrobiales bacterium]